MKKISIVSSASLGFLLLASAVAILTLSVFKEAEAALFAGIATLVATGALTLIIKERKTVNIVCFVVNAAAMGCLIRAWYLFRGFDNSFITMFFVSLATVLYLWVFFALSKIPFIHRSKAAYTVLCIAYVLLSVLVYVIAVATTHTTYLSTFGYYMAIELAFIFAMSLDTENPDELIRNLTLSTYSIFIVVIIAAVVVAVIAGGDGDCDCDCGPEGCECCCEGLDCFDGCNCGGERTVQKAKKKK